MFDQKRRRYYRLDVNDQLVARLERMSRAELVAWADAQLRAAPASEMFRLLIGTLEPRNDQPRQRTAVA